MTHKMNFLLFAVKLLPELTTVFFRLGRRNQTPQVHSFQSKIPRLSTEIFFLYHSSKSFSIFPHPFSKYGHIPVTCAVNRGNTICSLFEIPFYTACYHLSPSLESCLPRILYSVLEVWSTYIAPQHRTLCLNSKCDFTRGLRRRWLPVNLANYMHHARRDSHTCRALKPS